MDPFSYLIAFVAVVPALALSRVLVGLADLIQHGLSDTPGRVLWSGLFVLVSLLLIQSIAWSWWILYSWQGEGVFRFSTFCFLLVKPSILLFIARLLMPDTEPGLDVNLADHYFAVARWIYPLLAVVVLVDIMDTLLKGVGRFAEVGGAGYVLYIIGVAVFTASLGFVRQRGYHWAVLLLLTSMFALARILLGTGEIG